jgi:hypothetical protein
MGKNTQAQQKDFFPPMFLCCSWKTTNNIDKSDNAKTLNTTTA